jgi:OmcA/MtrC family decaheme c-type cytochrome
MQTRKFWIISIGCLAVAVAGGNPDRHRPFTPRDRAFFADDLTVQFVRPGLTVVVQSAAIAANGTISVNFTLTDPQGLALDRNGISTPGSISLSFIAATIPQGQEQYVAYTVRSATGAVSGTVNQAGADSGGTYTDIATGKYTYTFATKAPAGFNTAATHTIGIYGSRDLTLFDLGTNYASTTYNFVPNGTTVVTTRDVVRDASCNRCHDQLSFHGGSRRGVALCVMCHQPQTVDPDTGNTLDMKIFIHKIHMGSQLPSVIAGTPYKIIGRNGAVSDYSEVVFPADIRRCAVCHDSSTGAAQANAWLTKPSRASCGSCHDDVNFATGANHVAGAYPDDTQCAVCHVPQSTHDFDYSITGAHVVPTESSLLSGLIAKITKVTGGTAGNKPTVTFTIQDKNGNGVPRSALSSLSLTMAGPTTDYGNTSFGSDTSSTPGYVTEAAASPSCGADGTCTYTFTHAVPAGSTGTYAIGLEARRSETILSGMPHQQTIQYGALNPVSYFSVDGSKLAPRRQIVTLSNCNQCHAALSLHGTLRNNTEYCVMCHNPSNSDFTVRGSATNPADKLLPPQGINFNLMVHRIHFGSNAAADGPKNPYIIVGFGGSHNDFSDVNFPAMSPTGSVTDTRNCDLCHTGSSQLNLPLGLNNVTDQQGWTNPNPAISSACSGCHVSKAMASHMLAQTTSLGESCTVCHQAGADQAVDKVHAQY